MKRILIATLALTMIATVAGAHNGPPSSAPQGNGGMMGRGAGDGHGFGDGQGFGRGPGARALVGADGTVYVTDTVVDTATNTATTTVKAISPAGAVRWSATLPAGSRGLELSGTTLLTVSETTTDNTTFTSTITAISTASGSVAWTRSIPGRAAELVPFNGGTYLFVVTPATTTGGTATRSLVALGNDGSVLWTLAL